MTKPNQSESSQSDVSGQLDEYDPEDDLRASIEFAYEEIRNRSVSGGKGWRGYPAVFCPK